MQGPPPYGKTPSQASQSFDFDWDPPPPRLSDRVGSPPTPTSMSSHSTGRESTSGAHRVPQAYRPFTPSPSVAALSKLNDEDLRQKGIQDLIQILRRVENDYKALMGEHGNIMKDVNRRIQILSLDMKGLREMSDKLQEENQELRDLCCFLDDDRQKGRKLAREWQRFGRYTASVMRSEVVAYQEKLRVLESMQQELVNDNRELKELCLFLDAERHPQGHRDEGDGSSNSTTAGQEDGHPEPADHPHHPTSTTQSVLGRPEAGDNATAVYIRQLEDRVRQLEEEKRQLAQRVERSVGDGLHSSEKPAAPPKRDTGPAPPTQPQRSAAGGGVTGPSSQAGRSHLSPSGKPEAVVHAMKVLQVHEQLERPQTGAEEENLDDREKAIVREMCNVVWKKLGDGAGAERNASRKSSPPGPLPPRSARPPFSPSLVGTVHPAVSSQPTSLPSYFPHQTVGTPQTSAAHAPGLSHPGAAQLPSGSSLQQQLQQPTSQSLNGPVKGSGLANIPYHSPPSSKSQPSSLPVNSSGQGGGRGVGGGPAPSQDRPLHSSQGSVRFAPQGQGSGPSSLPGNIQGAPPLQDGPSSLGIPPRVPAAAVPPSQPIGQIPLGQGQVYPGQGYHLQRGLGGYPSGAPLTSQEPPLPPPPPAHQPFQQQEWRQKYLDPRNGQQ